MLHMFTSQGRLGDWVVFGISFCSEPGKRESLKSHGSRSEGAFFLIGYRKRFLTPLRYSYVYLRFACLLAGAWEVGGVGRFDWCSAGLPDFPEQRKGYVQLLAAPSRGCPPLILLPRPVVYQQASDQHLCPSGGDPGFEAKTSVNAFLKAHVGLELPRSENTIACTWL